MSCKHGEFCTPSCGVSQCYKVKTKGLPLADVVEGIRREARRVQTRVSVIPDLYRAEPEDVSHICKDFECHIQSVINLTRDVEQILDLNSPLYEDRLPVEVSNQIQNVCMKIWDNGYDCGPGDRSYIVYLPGEDVLLEGMKPGDDPFPETHQPPENVPGILDEVCDHCTMLLDHIVFGHTKENCIAARKTAVMMNHVHGGRAARRCEVIHTDARQQANEAIKHGFERQVRLLEARERYE